MSSIILAIYTVDVINGRSSSTVKLLIMTRTPLVYGSFFEKPMQRLEGPRDVERVDVGFWRKWVRKYLPVGMC